MVSPLTIPRVAPPSPDTPSFSGGLGIEGLPTPTSSTFDPSLLSPSVESFQSTYTPSPERSTPPTSVLSNGSAAAAARRGPFNFQPMIASKSPPIGKPNQRRGHRYKHSSISHQIFLEPPVRAPLALPASLPIPTRAELLRSISPPQRTRLLWCVCHLAVAGVTLWSAQGSLAVTALSHLIMFDALGASVCVVVDVLSNFEVWKRSSVRHPFGLERAEVLAGFAMAVLLLFMGFDIISHTAEHLVEGYCASPIIDTDTSTSTGAPPPHGATHPPHDAHLHHARISPGSIDLASLAALLSTLISGALLKNHARIGKALSIPLIPNPSHLLTVIASLLLLLIPLTSTHFSALLDRGLALAMAVCMIAIGVRLVRGLGSMLLMSYAGPGVADVVHGIEGDKAVVGVEEVKFWQVHTGLAMASVKVLVGAGVAGEEGRVKERVARLVKAGLGAKGVRWEVSVALETV